jgi:hypothetical protein
LTAKGRLRSKGLNLWINLSSYKYLSALPVIKKHLKSIHPRLNSETLIHGSSVLGNLNNGSNMFGINRNPAPTKIK